jgi:hypothetical protein
MTPSKRPCLMTVKPSSTLIASKAASNSKEKISGTRRPLLAK